VPLVVLVEVLDVLVDDVVLGDEVVLLSVVVLVVVELLWHFHTGRQLPSPPAATGVSTPAAAAPTISRPRRYLAAVFIGWLTSYTR
jgi:hypothetical protein